MTSQETNEIMKLMDKAESKKSDITSRIKKAEDKKRQDEEQLHDSEKRIVRKTANNVNASEELAKVVHEKSQIMDDDHELAELRKNWADLNNKIAQIKQLTGQSEYEEESKRREALAQAKSLYNSL